MPDRSPRAALMMLAAVACFSLMDAGLKQLSTHYPAFQVAALRCAASLPFVLAWALRRGGLAPLLRVRWPLHLLRGAMGVAMMASFVYALKTLPLSTAYSLFFVAPLLVTAMSVPILRERVGPRRWTAIGVGLLSPLFYILVLAALTSGAPLSLVAPMREMSMMVGALLGMLILREKVGPWRLVGCGVLIAGVILLSGA